MTSRIILYFSLVYILIGCATSYKPPTNQLTATLLIDRPFDNVNYFTLGPITGSTRTIYISDINEKGCTARAQIVKDKDWKKEGILVPAAKEIAIETITSFTEYPYKNSCSLILAVVLEPDNIYKIAEKGDSRGCNMTIVNTTTNLPVYAYQLNQTGTARSWQGFGGCKGPILPVR